MINDFIDTVKEFLANHNLMKRIYYGDVFIYVDKDGNPTNEMTDKIRWLRPVFVYCYRKDKDDAITKAITGLYPEYEGFFNIW